MFMLVLHILCHNLVGYESSRGLGSKIAECGYDTSKSGYEKSIGTKRLATTGKVFFRGRMRSNKETEHSCARSASL